MSTNSIIALADGDGFKDGVYCHWNGYPSAQGPALLYLTRDRSVGDLWEHLHQHAWSLLAYEGINWDAQLDDNHKALIPGIGVAYTNIDHPSSYSWHGTAEFRQFDYTEWVYVLHPESNTIAVFMVNWDNGAPLLVGSFKGGAGHVDWTRLECGPDYEWCEHDAYIHFDVPAASIRLSTRAWLGRRPFDLDDAIAFERDGVIYKRTGSGRRERNGGDVKPGWQETVLHPDTGEQMWLRVWNVYKSGKKMVKGIRPIYPPTQADLEKVDV